MSSLTKTLALAVIAAVLIGMPCIAQEVEPPFTWAGKGTASILSEGGTKDIDFQFELSFDEQGMVSGQSSNEEGTSKIKHVFYTEKKEYDWPGFFTRNIVIVQIINEEGGTPMITVLNGRLLVDKFLYGEMLLTTYEKGSDTARKLGIGNPEATMMESDELPSELRSALKKCFPLGMVKIEGDYKKEAREVKADTGSTGAVASPGTK